MFFPNRMERRDCWRDTAFLMGCRSPVKTRQASQNDRLTYV